MLSVGATTATFSEGAGLLAAFSQTALHSDLVSYCRVRSNGSSSVERASSKHGLTFGVLLSKVSLISLWEVFLILLEPILHGILTFSGP